jgi:hypothetical protein
VSLLVVTLGLCALCAVVLLAVYRITALVGLVLLASVLSRLSVPLGSVSVRPEHAAILVLAVAVLVQRGPRRIVEAASSPPLVLLAAYVAYSTVISLLMAPQFSRSIVILGWLGLDWILLVSLIASGVPLERLYQQFTRVTIAAAAFAIAMWSSALLGVTTFGASSDTASKVPAAYGLSYEPNLLASFLALAVIVILARPPGLPKGPYRLALTLALVALPMTQTRAAVVALVLGVVVLGLGHSPAVTRRSRLILVTAGATGALLFASNSAVLSARIFAKFGALLDFSEGNGAYRVGLTRLAFDDLGSGSGLIFGLGTNSFPQRHLDPSRPGLDMPAYLSSLPVQVVYDTGLVGLLLVAMLTVSLARRRNFSVNSSAVLITYLVASTSTSMLWFSTTWILAAMAMTSATPVMPAAISRRADTEPSDAPQTPASPRPSSLRATREINGATHPPSAPPSRTSSTL